ncbi:MAG: hypothetical protein H7A01_01945 [Hahellaceae bacterium]|nr:hypothetical protein [Hahellaceae bacterium]MCP5212594.1 hypothetical protein [Hahellaceae bacterium]
MDISSLLIEGVDAVLDLASQLDQTDNLDADVNWLGLSSQCIGAAQKSFDMGNSVNGKKWLLAALKIHNFLAEHSANENLKLGHEISMLRIKVKAIGHLGIDCEEELLDIRSIRQWFFRKVNLTPEEAEEKSRSWVTIPKDEITRLRNLKNILNALEPLKNCNGIHEDLKEWLALKNKLP